MAHEASRGYINMQVCAVSGCNLILFSTSSCSVNVLHYYKCFARQGNRQRFSDFAALWLQQNIHLRSTNNNRNVAGRSSETISSTPLLICPAPSSTSNTSRLEQPHSRAADPIIALFRGFSDADDSSLLAPVTINGDCGLGTGHEGSAEDHGAGSGPSPVRSKAPLFGADGKDGLGDGCSRGSRERHRCSRRRGERGKGKGRSPGGQLVEATFYEPPAASCRSHPGVVSFLVLHECGWNSCRHCCSCGGCGPSSCSCWSLAPCTSCTTTGSRSGTDPSAAYTCSLWGRGGCCLWPAPKKETL